MTYDERSVWHGRQLGREDREGECQSLLNEIAHLRAERDDLLAANIQCGKDGDEIDRLRALNTKLTAVLKGIEIYSISHDDARGMAAKALLDD